MVSKEPGLPYYRLNLTRLLAGEVDEQGLAMRPREWFEEHGYEVELVVPYNPKAAYRVWHRILKPDRPR